MKSRTALIVVAGAVFLLFVPWLGNLFFYTKGEPREAIVAVSMLASGDWLLPVSYGCDLPYKPPMLAWLIAGLSWLLAGGHVTEFTSRLPSALASIAIAVATWRLLRPRCGSRTAWVTVLVMVTSFEFFRASTACRVDMVLTAFMIGGIYAIFTMRGHPWRVLWAILLLSGAVLTKGPVGALLPCLAMGIYMLLRGDNFWRAFLTLMLICVSSFVIPALWYYAAWLRGGDGFAQLAWEENIGRLTGTMSYDSHLNPWHYNLWSLLAGMLPWTVPVLLGFVYSRLRRSVMSLKMDRGLPLMAWTVALTVLVFYCFPSSKRSVYLLPCYPFLAYGASWVLRKISATPLMRVWAIFMAMLAIVAPAILVAGVCGTFKGLALAPLRWWLWPVAFLPMACGLWWLCTRSGRAPAMFGAIGLTYVILLAYNAAYMPVVLNSRSDVAAAQKIAERVPEGAPIVSYIANDRLLRYYGMDFYLGDRLRNVGSLGAVPADAWLVTDPANTPLIGDTLTLRSADTRRPVVLIAPLNHKIKN